MIRDSAKSLKNTYPLPRIRYTFFIRRFLFLFFAFLLISCSPSADVSNDAPEDPEVKAAVTIDEYAILGNPEAPVTLVEYSDYHCPFCKKFTAEVLPKIKEEYIDKGLVRLIYKDFPLEIHDKAIGAAIATHCAGKQGAYYAYHDHLFAGDIEDYEYVDWAEYLDLDTAVFESCLEDSAMREVVLSSIKEAKSQGVRGTPSFLLNGRYIAGAQPFSFFERAIKSALNEQIDEPETSTDAVCSRDEDCGEARPFPPFCAHSTDTQSCVVIGTPTCTYPGTTESACVMIITEECTECGEGEVCREGVCT